MNRFDLLVDMGCCVCKKFYAVTTPPEIHHLRMGVGMGQRSLSDRTIPLCPSHHRTGGYETAFHAGKKGFEKRFGTEEELLQWVNNELEGSSESSSLPEAT